MGHHVRRLLDVLEHEAERDRIDVSFIRLGFAAAPEDVGTHLNSHPSLLQVVVERLAQGVNDFSALFFFVRQRPS